jgi:beta-lactamase superfamily II metal-dependent hydrolase
MAKPTIRIRSYNVGFGDCFLVTVPDGGQTRHMLVDFGNAPGQRNTNYPAIADDINNETGGHLDLVVMTHEHLDHLEGFYDQRKIFSKMTVDWVWMGLPSKPGYYKDYPKARPIKHLRELAEEFDRRMSIRGVPFAPSFQTLLKNNLSNADRIDYIRKLSGKAKRVLYLRRGHSVLNKPFSNKVKITFIAPESDMSVYYPKKGGNSIQAIARRLVSANSDAEVAASDGDDWRFPGVPRETGSPPNLTERDWRLLREMIQVGGVESIRALDKAANNTSLAFVIEVAGHRLLFPGDAELESWAMIAKKCPAQLKPVDFLKVGHHGSHNGTPTDQLDRLLPKTRKSKATIMVSTESKVYGTQNPVPDEDLMTDLEGRCKKLLTTDGSSDLWIDAHL